MTENDAPEVVDAPTCYRHPDRETYVRCTRCDRSICPDCMNEASVGFQCPECVREGAKTVRQARTVFGGRVGADANVTKILIGLNVLMFFAQLASDTVTFDYYMNPAAVAVLGEYYRMITSAFLHDERLVFHIMMNMYALFAFGSQIERLLGTTRYLALYLVSALGGSVATYLFMKPISASLGASGAVFGLFGAYFVLARTLRADTSQVVVLLVINLVFGFLGRNFINNYAHIGGLLTGGAIAWVYTQGRQHPRRALIHLGGVALVAVALVAATVTRTPAVKDQVILEIEDSSAAAWSPEVPSR